MILELMLEQLSQIGDVVLAKPEGSALEPVRDGATGRAEASTHAAVVRHAETVAKSRRAGVQRVGERRLDVSRYTAHRLECAAVIVFHRRVHGAFSVGFARLVRSARAKWQASYPSPAATATDLT